MRPGRGWDEAAATTTAPLQVRPGPRAWSALDTPSSSAPLLPRDPWDLQLDWVVTERGAVRCWRGEDPLPVEKGGRKTQWNIW